MSPEKIITLITLGLYFLFMLWIGRKASEKVTNLNDYILAGRGVAWPLILMTFLATIASPAQILGQPGFSYSNGISLYFWEKATFATTIVLLTLPLTKRLRHMKVTTISDIVFARFPNSKRVNYILTVIQISWSVFVAALAVFGGSLLVTAVTGIPLSVSIFVIVGVTLVYTILGGLNAVVITDAAQWGIIIIGTAIFIPLLYFSVGSFSSFFSQYLGPDGFSLTQLAADTSLFEGFTDIYTLPVTLLIAIAFFISASALPAVDPAFIQRLLAAKSDKHAKVGLILFAVMFFLVMIMIIAIGNYAGALLPNVENPDNSLLYMAQEHLPMIGSALFLTAVAAAAMSTVSSYLNVAAGMIVKNIILVVKPKISDRQQILWARISTFIVAILALSFAPIASTGLSVAAVSAQLLLVTTVGPLIYLLLFWKRFTERGAFWGSIITMSTTFILIAVVGPNDAILGPGILGIPILFWGIIISAITFVGISLADSLSANKMSPEFQTMFADKSLPTMKPSKKALGGIGLMWLILFIPKMYMELTDTNVSFPTLSGPFTWFTDGMFLVISAVTVIITAYLGVRIYKYVRELTKKDIQKEDFDSDINSNI